jgi:hypothetical protein
MTLMSQTTDDMTGIMTVDGGAPILTGSQANVYTLEPGTSATFELLVVARDVAADETAGWNIKGLVARSRSSGDSRIIGDPYIETWADGGAENWIVWVTADTSDQFLKVAVAGRTQETIQWSARLTTAELTVQQS